MKNDYGGFYTMARFRYKAKNMSGRTKGGVMDAANEKILQQKLKEDGLYLISAKDLNQSRRRRFNSRQLADFSRELSNLLRAGVSLVRALDIISQEEGLAAFARDVYIELLSDLKKGVSLSEAMENRNCFPGLMRGMIRSGEGNGNLDEVTSRLADHYEKDARLNQQVKSAMTYPIVLLVMCVAIMLIIVTFVLPQFEELFAQMESLPVPTEMVLAISHFLISYWYIALVAVLLLVAGLRLLMQVPRVRRSIDSMKVHLPVFGKLNRVIYTARFARTLSSLYTSGIPVGSSLKMAAETIGNLYVEEQFEQVSVKVRGGTPLSEALRTVDGLQNKLASTILIGEESGRLDTMLDSIAASLEVEAQEATKRMVTLIEPLMICVMAFIVAFVIIAVMLPIYQSYSAIEGAA